MYYHHESLLQYEAQQRYEEASDWEDDYFTYYVKTPTWEADALDDSQLQDLLSEAILSGFDDSQISVQKIPF
jgi:hypothetical protein